MSLLSFNFLGRCVHKTGVTPMMSIHGKVTNVVLSNTNITIIITRSYAALRAADLDWIVGPKYSLGGGQGRNK